MKNILKVFLLFLILSSLSFSQESYLDTFYVVTNKEFKIPRDQNIVFSNILDMNYTGEVFSLDGTKIRDCDNFFQTPSKEDLRKKVQQKKGRGEIVQINLTEKFEKTGNYVVKIHFNFKDEKGSNKVSGNYLVVVDNPTVVNKINVAERYYPTEKATFSFATIEYQDNSLYSYEILDEAGGILVSGKGPVVSLDSIINVQDYVGRQFTVVGKYDGKEFDYTVVGNNSEIKKSKWTFNIALPSIDSFVIWKDLGNDKIDKTKEVYITAYNDLEIRFLYVYLGTAEDGNLIAIQPRITGLRIEAEPNGYLTGAGGSVFYGGKFAIITLTPNQNFIDSIEQCGDAPIKISVRFNTQYERNKSFEYSAVILK